MTTFSKTQMIKRVDGFIASERTTAKELRTLSRDLLTYVYDDFKPENGCNDVLTLNRFIDGLSPANRKVAMQFFPQFVGWMWDKEAERFGKKDKTKNYLRKLKLTQESLDNPEWDMLSWFEAKGQKSEKKPKDHKKAVQNALVNGFKEEGENKLTTKDVALILLATDGLDLRKLMSACDGLADL